MASERIGCLFCRYSNAIVEDNHGELHTLCSCQESPHFLHPVDLAFGRCGREERDEVDEDEAD